MRLALVVAPAANGPEVVERNAGGRIVVETCSPMPPGGPTGSRRASIAGGTLGGKRVVPRDPTCRRPGAEAWGLDGAAPVGEARRPRGR